MRHYFVDTNVLLDFVLLRDDFGTAAQQLFEAGATNQAVLYASGLSFSHIYYTMRKTNLAAERLAALSILAGLVEIIPVGRAVIEAALTLGFADFEDGLQYCAARTVPAIEALVTRDPKGFAAGTLPVLTPPAALARLSR
ncbi:MAG: PIN domain-containing protein [Hymenobacter sp.]|nr:MAG: PIN domain-containing protein [Hymenobacter sp.]